MSEAILVTGGDGFLGGHLVEALRSKGHVVYVHTRAMGNIAHCTLDTPGIEHVFHLAAKSFVPDSWAFPQPFYETNVLGTVNILEYCRRQQASLTYISSYVYGRPDSLPIAEDHPLRPLNPYSHTKILAEEAVNYYRAEFSVAATIVRPFNVYGPGQNDRFLIPTIIRQALNQNINEITVTDLRPRRDYIYIDDLISLLLLTIRQLPGTTYNAGSGYSVSIDELTEQINYLTGTGKKVRSLMAPRPEEVLDVVADISRAKAELHWTPSVTLRDGLRHTISWMERSQ